MNVSVFGLGHVGAVSAACFAALGHHVIGVEIDPRRMAMIVDGRSPVAEPGLDELIACQRQEGRLGVIADASAAVLATELSLVCVGTPSARDGSPDLSEVEAVTRQIGAALAIKTAWHGVVYRSTMLPGTTESRLIPLLEESSGKMAGRDFGVAVNPEFLREGSGIADFHSPARLVIGAPDAASAAALVRLYEGIEAPHAHLSLREAEICKYVDNAFHAAKVAFANEMGTLCHLHGIDGRRVMEVFCMDTRLNLSPNYLRPGPAFGGSCLPKDLRALRQRARSLHAATPLLDAILPSNDSHKARVLELIVGAGKRRIGILGLSFKEGTADLRESPTLEIVERLIAMGYELTLYDRGLSCSRSAGSPVEGSERHPPVPASLARLLRPALEDVLQQAEVLVVASRDPEFFDLSDRVRPGVVLLDLVGLPVWDNRTADYHGICW